MAATGTVDYNTIALRNELFGPDIAGTAGYVKSINLEYLVRRTKSNPTLMMEMILLYVDQTPPIINAMKQSLLDEDWNLLQSAVHKIIPSFSIMGISSDFESMAKKIHEYARQSALSAKEGKDKFIHASFPIKMSTGQLNRPELFEMILQLENVCARACEELKEEYTKIKNQN